MTRLGFSERGQPVYRESRKMCSYLCRFWTGYLTMLVSRLCSAGVRLERQKKHEKALVRIASVSAEIRTEHLQNTNLEHPVQCYF
jgi:hypothetical protein